MSTVTTKDGTQIYYKDWGAGPPVVFSHGWPLNADSWGAQMVFLASKGYRCIAHDRRGHGRSSQPWNGNKNTLDCIKAFSETDFTEDLKKFDVPTLLVHGDDDQIVPIDAAGRASARIVENANLIVYSGAPHGLTDTHKDKLNADLLAFLTAHDGTSPET